MSFDWHISYRNPQKYNITGNTKIWIVGYSRGGAVANLTAGEINNGHVFPNILRLLDLKLGDHAISSERVQRALSSFGCEEIAHGVERLSVALPQSEYKTGKDENGNVYMTLQLSDKDETVQDLLTVQSAFGQIFDYVNVKQPILGKYLKNIRFAITNV